MPNEETLRDGSASVFQGHVVVTDPSGTGRPAVLEPGPGLILYVNGEEVSQPVEVTSSDDVQVELMAEPGEVKVRVEVTDNGLEAKAALDLVPETRFCLVDSRPRQQLVLQTKKESQPPLVAPLLIEQALQEKGVFVGVDKRAIASLAAEGSGTPKLVARGRSPVPGQDARIELKFEDQQNHKLPGSEELRVDWRELRSIPTVETGDELAVKHKAVLGQPGLSVSGQPISPQVPMDVELVAGEGVQIVNGGDRKSGG